MTDLADLVEPLKRELAVPGTFETTFPDTDDDALGASLLDGFSEARLQGFFSDVVLDVDTGETDLDLSLAGQALIVLFTASRIIRAQMRSLNTSEKYSAKTGTSFEIQKSATLLKGELDYMRDRINELVAAARAARAPLAVVLDSYVSRAGAQLATAGYGGFFTYEWK